LHLNPVAPDRLPPFLQVRGLAKAYGGVRALNGVDLDLEAGRSLTLIGPNGCGKTTLLRVLSGEIAPDKGAVRLVGREIQGQPSFHVARLGIARKLQTPGVWSALSVAEHLRVALFARAGQRGLLGLLAREQKTEIADLARLAGLSEVLDRPAGELPHGAKQWLEIAMLLALRPRLLLLDEPTAGMTPAETRRTADLVRRTCEAAGIAAIVIEHDLAFVRELAAPVAVMSRGRIIRRGDYASIAADPLVRELYLGHRTRC
jgi:ABC-type uncharacterized transport system ATPase subunit